MKEMIFFEIVCSLFHLDWFALSAEFDMHIAKDRRVVIGPYDDEVGESREDPLEKGMATHSRGSSRPRDQTYVSCLLHCRRVLYHCDTWEYAFSSPQRHPITCLHHLLQQRTGWVEDSCYGSRNSAGSPTPSRPDQSRRHVRSTLAEHRCCGWVRQSSP